MKLHLDYIDGYKCIFQIKKKNVWFKSKPEKISFLKRKTKNK